MALALLVIPPAWPGAPASAQSPDPLSAILETGGGRLPSGRSGTSAVWTGTEAYVFGGSTNGEWNDLDEIVRFAPGTSTPTEVVARLPRPLAWTSAVWDGRDLPLLGCPGGCAYIIGGLDIWTDTGRSDVIFRFNPTTGAVKLMDARLPTPRERTSAVWDGAAHAYVFGGRDETGALRDILQYDPVLDEVVVIETTLGEIGWEGTAAAWDGTSAYLIGGLGMWGGNEIYNWRLGRFTPAAGLVEWIEFGAPYGVTAASMVWDNANVIVFGGLARLYTPNSEPYEEPSYDILRINPVTRTFVYDHAAPLFPAHPLWTSAVWTGTRAYVFGGDDYYRNSEAIVEHVPPALPAGTWRGAYVGAGMLRDQNGARLVLPDCTTLGIASINLNIFGKWDLSVENAPCASTPYTWTSMTGSPTSGFSHDTYTQTANACGDGRGTLRRWTHLHVGALSAKTPLSYSTLQTCANVPGWQRTTHLTGVLRFTSTNGDT